jgi:hypothetical protein
MLLDLIPLIYNGERVIRIVGEDGKIEKFAQINSRMPGGAVFNDISVGQFDLEVSTGPAFATKRMEAADKMMQLVQANPAIGQAGADIIVKALDIPYGDKLGDRLALMLLPPGIDPEVDKKRMEMQASMQPQGPDPAQQMAMAQAEAETQKTQSEAARNMADAQLKEIQAASQAASIQQMVQQAVAAEMAKVGFAFGIGDGL